MRISEKTLVLLASLVALVIVVISLTVWDGTRTNQAAITQRQEVCIEAGSSPAECATFERMRVDD